MAARTDSLFWSMDQVLELQHLIAIVFDHSPFNFCDFLQLGFVLMCIKMVKMS